MPLALSTYNVVEALHVIAVIGALGLPLSYPVLMPYFRRTHPRAMPAVHAAQHRMAQRVISPGLLVVLVLGAYLAGKGHYCGEAWVIVPLAILVVIGGLVGSVIAPGSQRLVQLARHDVEAAPAGGEASFGPEYEALYRRVMTAEYLFGLLVLVAIFFMAARPFS
jgi:uncharacterized membrane protein